MTDRVGASASLRERCPTVERLGVLTRDINVRLLNYSATGCLLESTIPLAAGTVGYVRLCIDGDEYVDAIEVVRCRPTPGADGGHRIGARFLWPIATRRTDGRAPSFGDKSHAIR